MTNQRFAQEASRKSSQEVVKTKESIKENAKFVLNSKKWNALFQEADEVNREIVWLITEQRPQYNKTLFGKVLRAKSQYQKVKLKNKSQHACDNYHIKVEEAYFQVFEFCQKHRDPDLLAQVNIKGRHHLHFTFYGQNFADIIGVSAALVSPKIECDLLVTANLGLQKLTCETFKFTRRGQVVELKKFIFDKEANPTISLEGQILENMLPYSKLQVFVPEVGKIKIREIKLRPDPDEYDPKKVKTPKTPTPTQTPPASQPSGEKPQFQEPQGAEMTSPREQDKYIFTPEGEKIIKHSEPDMIELKQETPNSR